MTEDLVGLIPMLIMDNGKEFDRYRRIAAALDTVGIPTEMAVSTWVDHVIDQHDGNDST